MTIKTADIRNRLKSVLVNAGITYQKGGGTESVALVFPNIKAKEGQKPRIEMRLVNAQQSDGTLAGNERKEERGMYEFIIVVPFNEGEQLANEISDKVQAAYPSGSNFTIPNGVVQIPSLPSIGSFMSYEGYEGRGVVYVSYIASSD